MAQTATPKVILGTIAGNNDNGTIQMVKDGIDTLNRIISSSEYENEFSNFHFVQTEGKTNKQLWDLFVAASPVKINVDIRNMGFWANRFHGTVGLEDPNFPDTVFMNSHFVDTSYLVGDNALHEIWHILGFSHEHASDATSIPYGNNTIYKTVAKILQIDENI